MIILIEGQKYKLSFLKGIFSDSKFYQTEDDFGLILSVGYYHNFQSGELVYMLPKVFMLDGEVTVFGINKDRLLDLNLRKTTKHGETFEWIRRTSVYFYKSLVEFKKRNLQTSILQISALPKFNKIFGTQRYTFLDLLLSFVDFYIKHKNLIFFRYVELKSLNSKRTSWNKTVTKSVPILNKSKQPVYNVFRVTKKEIDAEEELLVYFLSIISYFNYEYGLSLQIDRRYTLLTGNQFKKLQKNGLSKLRRIKYRYFNDITRQMYRLCELYFTNNDLAGLGKKRDEFICVNNYNLVFEDMIDKIFSDEILGENTSAKTSLKALKNNDDGKIIDHIFDFQSLLDTSNIFYIGDSKYYKSENTAGKVSKYKQFTYAKNIIQYNIDLLNETGGYYTSKIRYRDELTEGYNITPNFFIYGYIEDFKNFDHAKLDLKGECIKSFHYSDRLFDRDTLFIHQYKINFLYVLRFYTENTTSLVNDFRFYTKNTFRKNFIDYFSSEDNSGFSFSQYTKKDINTFVEKNFKKLNGKCFLSNCGVLILAKHNGDKTIADIMVDFVPHKLV